MIRTVIVEDDDAAAELLAGYLDRYGGEHGETFSSVRYDNAVTFLEKYASDADIVFMDIEMEDLDGMKAAAKLRERDRSVTLIFVTNMAQFAIKGYEVDALDFIVKPVGYHDFAFRLKKAVARIRANEEKYVSVNLLGGRVCQSGGLAHKVRRDNETPYDLAYRGRRFRVLRHA